MAAALAGAWTASAVITIDGTINPGEWHGATTYTIGNGGGTAYFKADTSFIYGAFDITGWTAAMGPASGGNALGFGVWGANNSYPNHPGVEFAQGTDAAAFGGSYSAMMNGLQSAFKLDAVVQASIPDSLQAADSFATGHRVWEVMMPISTMTVNVGDTIWAVGGINYNSAQHWYPDTFVPDYNGYAPITVGAPVPEPTTMIAGALLLLPFGASTLRMLRKSRKA